MRARFKKGKQRKFIDNVLLVLGCPSLYELINRGADVNLNSLKNYHTERRLIPPDVVESLCTLSGIKKESLNFEIINENWGQIKGGKKGKRKRLKRGKAY